MNKTTRRGFMMGCSSAIAALAGSRIRFAAFGDSQGSFNEDIVVVVFLRGGIDGLNFLVPLDGSDRGHYEAARPNIAVPTTGSNAAVPLNAQFGLHPAAAALQGIYQNDDLAIVHAVGMDVSTRSHFDAMEYMELGTPGNKSTPTGWLSRHLSTADNLPAEILMPSVAVQSIQPDSLLGNRETIALSNPDQFNLDSGPWRWRDPQRLALRRLYEGDSQITHQTGLQAMDAADIIEAYVSGDYTPSNGAVYPDNTFGDQLQIIAQLVKLDVGLRICTIDLGGWDTHENQGNDGGGYYSGLLGTLAEGLAALYTDFDGAGGQNYNQKVTVVVQSEFGRRFYQNANRGTDHGSANRMLVMGANAIGGLHGTWPGLAPGQLFEGIDLAPTTDFRQVLSEILIRRLANPRLGRIFPGYSNYQPLGVVSGTDLPPDYSTGGANEVFRDGFESGNLTAWSGSVG